jgi:hypothetical protein
VTYTYDSGMELTFGIVFLVVLAGTTLYAIGRMIYERINPPHVVAPPVVIPFAAAVRHANRIARERVIAESPTVTLVLPRNPDGSLSEPERAPHPGARTVDVPHQQRVIGRHAVLPGMTEVA